MLIPNQAPPVSVKFSDDFEGKKVGIFPSEVYTVRCMGRCRPVPSLGLNWSRPRSYRARALNRAEALERCKNQIRFKCSPVGGVAYNCRFDP